MNLNKNQTTEQPQYIYRRIDGTSYKVKVVFSGEAQETMEDKEKLCDWEEVSASSFYFANYNFTLTSLKSIDLSFIVW